MQSAAQWAGPPFPHDALQLLGLEKVPPDVETLSAVAFDKMKRADCEEASLALGAAQRQVAEWMQCFQGASSSSSVEPKSKMPRVEESGESSREPSDELVLSLSDGIRYEPCAPKPVNEAELVAAFYKDAQTVANCRPIGQPNWETLAAEVAPTLALARSGGVASADVPAVEDADAAAVRFAEMGYRVEMKPRGSASQDDACMWDHRTSWVLGAQVPAQEADVEPPRM